MTWARVPAGADGQAQMLCLVAEVHMPLYSTDARRPDSKTDAAAALPADAKAVTAASATVGVRARFRQRFFFWALISVVAVHAQRVVWCNFSELLDEVWWPAMVYNVGSWVSFTVRGPYLPSCS